MKRTLGPASAPDDQVSSLERLYHRYGAMVLDRCRYVLKDAHAAEDAMQEVFAKALANLKSVESADSPLGWLMKVATHHCLNQIRSERSAGRVRYLRESAERSELGEGVVRIESRDVVRRVLLTVDEETQAAAIHYHVDEMTLEEVATLIGRSVPTIRVRLRTFARAASELLEDA